MASSPSRKTLLAQTLAGLGVILSLVFVGFELRQNTTAVRAQTRQGLADRSATVIYAVAENPELARAWRLRWIEGPVPGETLTPFDSTQANWAMFGILRHTEDIYLQVLEGVIDETALDSYGFRNNANFSRPTFAEWWPDRRQMFDPRFVAAFDEEYGFR